MNYDGKNVIVEEREWQKPSPPSAEKQEKNHLDKLAYAVAMAETGNCANGYGKMYNNCFGIKQGRTVPCAKIGKNKMCIYDNPAQSYEAFKKIWSKGYGGGFPTLRQASVWTGKDHAKTWLTNVTHHYNKQ